MPESNFLLTVTFILLQVSLIVKHEKFVPLSSPGGDGRNDIALLYIRTRGGHGINFDKFENIPVYFILTWL